MGLSVASKAVLSDSIASLGLVIAFYYGITDFACLIYFRHELLRNLRSLLALGLVPLIGAVGLTWVFIRTAFDLGHPASSASRAAPLGIGLPLLLAGCLLLLGLVLLGLTAWRSPSFPTGWNDDDVPVADEPSGGCVPNPPSPRFWRRRGRRS